MMEGDGGPDAIPAEQEAKRMKEPILIILAAGMGSRYGGLKQMDPVGPTGEAILDYSVYDAKRAGFKRVIFLIKHEIEEDFKRLVGQRIETHTCNGVEHSGLSRTVSADHGHKITFGKLQVKILEHVLFINCSNIKGFIDPIQLQHITRPPSFSFWQGD